MISVGITGGIGCGKSLICNVFEIYGVPIFDCDIEAKKLLDSSPIIKNQLIKAFGPELYHDGKIDKKRYAQIIFSSESNLKFSNELIHPEVKKMIRCWIDAHSEKKVLLVESALLIEAEIYKMLDKVICIESPVNLRIERVQKRSGLTQEQIKNRIDTQLTDEERRKFSDFVISNDETSSVIDQVNGIAIQLGLITPASIQKSPY